MYPLFELSCLLCLRQPENKRIYRQESDSPRIVHCAWSDVSGRTILALVISNGTLLLRYTGRDRVKPVVRQLKWSSDPSSQITALCFDPSGSWLICAVQDASLFIVPALSLMDATVKVDQLWPLDDITKIEMSGKRGEPTPMSSHVSTSNRERAQPTCITWWQTFNNKHIVIVGNELGEICFINLLTRQEVGGTYITVAIKTMHLIRDDTHDNVYLLITGGNGLQWQLLLEQPSTGYRWPLEQDSDGDDEIRGCVKDSGDHRPHRLSGFAGHTILKPQNARGRHFIAGYYAPTSILTIHSTDLNIAPLFVYKLLPSCNNIILTDRLLFITTKNQLTILSNQLSESTIDGKRDCDPNAQIQSFSLPNDERVVCILKNSGAKFNSQRTISAKPCPRSAPSSPRFGARIRRPSGSLGPALSSVTNSRRFSGRFSLVDKNEGGLDDVKISTLTRLDGCIVVLETMVFECKARMSPERLFLELVLTQHDMKASERLGITLGLDVNKLYETTADFQLSQGHFAAAVRLYQLSKCPHVRSVANFAAHGCVGELLSYVRVLFSNQGVEFPLSDRRHFANMELLCYVHQILEVKAGAATLMQAFRQFLRDNHHYSEPLAVQLLAEEGLYDLLGPLAEKRGLLLGMMEELLRPNSASWLDDNTSAALESRGYGMLIRGRHNEGFLKCLTMPSIIQHFFPNCNLSLIHSNLMVTLMPHLSIDLLLRLAVLYDPTRSCLRTHLKHAYSICIGGGDNFMQNDEDHSWETTIVDTFILTLIFLNARRSSHPFDLSLVTETLRVPSKIPSSPSKRPRLPRRSSPVGCGLAHAALVRNGAVYTWGKTDHCCLGCGPPTQECSTPVSLDFFSNLHNSKVVAVTCGAWHTVALTNNGVYAWGMSKYGQLGVGFFDKVPSPVLIEALIDERIVAVTSGQYHTLALTADGRVYSWGWGVHGQLGHSTPNDEPFPKVIKALANEIIVKVTAGYGHTAALTAKGDVYTFGCGIFGQLGTGSTSKNSTPQLVSLPEKINLISCGYFHNVVVSATNKIYTWGSNPQLLRIQAQASRRARLQSKNPQSENTEATTDDNSILGPQSHLLPSVIDNAVTSPITQVSCGSHHSAVLTMDGEVYTWGRNLDGQLGNGTRKEQRTPGCVVGLSNNKITHIGCGADFVIAIDTDGKVWGWGQNDCGQVGLDVDNTTSSGKTITIKTNRRIVQLRNTQQWGVVKPHLVGGLVPPRTSHEYEVSRSFEGENQDGGSLLERRFRLLKKLNPLIKYETPPFGSKTLHLILELFFGLYNKEKIHYWGTKLELPQISAKLCFLNGDYTQSFVFNLQALRHKIDAREIVPLVVQLVEVYLGLLPAGDINSTKLLLHQMVNFWLELQLDIEAIEMFFTKWLPRFVQPIASLLLNPNPDESRLPSILCKMSTKFCLSLASSLLIHLKSGFPNPDFLQLLTDYAKANLSSMPTHMVVGDNSCPNVIILRPRQLESLVHALDEEGGTSGDHTPSAAEVVLFSCGHHYTNRAFVSTILPQFEEAMRTLPITLTRTAQALLASYRSEGLQPMACPRCVLVGIKDSI